jgi:hypothetical protein
MEVRESGDYGQNSRQARGESVAAEFKSLKLSNLSGKIRQRHALCSLCFCVHKEHKTAYLILLRARFVVVLGGVKTKDVLSLA